MAASAAGPTRAKVIIRKPVFQTYRRGADLALGERQGPRRWSQRLMDVDVVIVGAGAVGLAVAAEFARAGRDVLVLEAADGIGAETSSRNSEVIHAGMYYPTGSLRHRMCVEGRRKLYRYLEQRG